MSPWLGVLWAACGTAAAAVMFNARLRDVPLIAACGAVGWAVFLGLGFCAVPAASACFVAAIAVGLVAEILAAGLGKPATIFAVCAVIPLVPGSGMFYTMLASVRGRGSEALKTGFTTLSIAGAVAAGLAISSAAARMLSHIAAERARRKDSAGAS